MTKPQVDLIKRLVAAERSYWKALVGGERFVQKRWRMVEVAGKFNGVDRRTVRSLEEVGLIEGVADENNQWWVWLKHEDSES